MRQIDSDSSTDSTQDPFNNNNLPSIFAFPKDEKPWRIDWFGELAFPNRMLRRKQPSLLVHLSRVIDDTYLADPEVLLSPQSTTTARQQRKVWVSVGTLPLLRIGDIWRNGRLDTKPDYQLESFTDLQIDKSTTSLVKAGLNLDENGFLLPLAEHPWHMQCTHSYCVMVDLPDNRKLIIPCIELIRFYFGSSSTLVTKLFLPPLERGSLYCNPHFDKLSSRLTIELANQISGASAADIGRLHLDPIAWRAALQVGTSALAASIANQGIHVQTFFPFEGKTNLIAAGKWLSFGNTPQVTFIAYNLRSCTHPFPFQSLRYKAGEKNKSPADSTERASTSPTTPTHRRTKDSPLQDLVDQDPSNRLAHKRIRFKVEARFPDLEKKTIWQNRRLSTAAADQFLATTGTAPVDQAAVGEGGSERRIRSIELQACIRPDAKFPAPEFLREIVEELKTLNGFKIELLTESDEDGWTIPITVLANEDGEIDVNLFVELEAGRLRERRVAIFSVTHKLERVNIVAIESLPVHMKFYLISDDQKELWKILRCAARDFAIKREPKNENIAHMIRWIFDVK